MTVSGFRFGRTKKLYEAKFLTYVKYVAIVCQLPGPTIAGAGPNARPRIRASLSSGLMMLTCSVNSVTTFLMNMV